MSSLPSTPPAWRGIFASFRPSRQCYVQPTFDLLLTFPPSALPPTPFSTSLLMVPQPTGWTTQQVLSSNRSGWMLINPSMVSMDGGSQGVGRGGARESTKPITKPYGPCLSACPPALPARMLG